MSKKRIGILTGGGDVPGLNVAIRNVVMRAEADNSYEVLGIRRGWAGLVLMDPEGKRDDSDHLFKLDSLFVRKIDRTGGTILHTSRTNPSNMTASSSLEKYRGLKLDKKTDLTQDVIKNIQRLGIEALIAIGGDDTLSFAVKLDQLGVPVIGIPKTMDNDVNGTEYCIGFSSCISKSMVMINDLRTPTGSHERIAVVELFGRNAGFTALYASLATGGIRTLIPEYDFDMDRLAKLLKEDRDKNPSRYAMVLIAEGAKPKGGEIIEGGKEDAFGHKKLGGISQIVGDALKDKINCDMVIQNLGYLVRAGAPDAIDEIVPSVWGNMAMDCLRDKKYGQMMAIVDGRYDCVPIKLATAKKRIVDVERCYDTERYMPKYTNLKGLPMLLR